MLPASGVVTFLMTDVEGSTRLWESDRQGMAASLAIHDRICRSVAAERRGYVFSTAGDAFAIAFSSPVDALGAAVGIQTALGSTEWPGPPIRIRIGLHTGTADERDGDYFGPTVNRAARIMSAAHGGQVLVSSVTADLLRSGFGPDVALVDRGLHGLSGFDTPERIFEVRAPGLDPVPGGLRTRAVEQTNLPEILSTFVGRSAELGAIFRHLESHRLVVLTGPGGTGKTRLAVEAGRSLRPRYPDGVWITELAPVVDPGLVMTAIGEVFGLRPGEGASIEDVVSRHLATRTALLIVDNCEHVLAGAVPAVRRLLGATTGIDLMATSRESLGIAGEVTVTVPSLGVPDGSGSDESESVRLLLDRAAAEDWTPGPGDRAAVDRICRRVDGIPLAIELAAARLRTLTPAELADRLDESFEVLVGRAKSTLPRHRTLEATIDWSYRLLDDAEQSAFRTVSVFVGGFDLAAAEHVVGGDDVLDLLDSLVDKSLLMSFRTGEGMRFRMLEPIRQYADARLVAEGESEETSAAHADHYVRRVAKAAVGTRGPDQIRTMRRLDLDYDNVRLAFRSLLDAGQVDDHLGMAFDLFAYWIHRGLQLEGIATCLTGLEHPASPLLRVKAWFVAALLGAEVTSPVAIDHARSGLEEARTLGEPAAIGWMEIALGAAIRHSTSDPEYLEHLVAGREILDGCPESWWESSWERAFRSLILAAYLPTDDDRVGEHGEVATTGFERIGDRAMYGAALLETALDPSGDFDRMAARFRQAVAVFEETPSIQWQAHARMNLGAVLRARGDVEEAAVQLAEAAIELDDIGDLSCWATSSRWLAHCELRLGMEDLARPRILDVIDRFDLLPMQEVAIPRTLDVIALMLAADGMHAEAAIALGCAEADPFAPALIPRPLDELRAMVEAELGAEETARLRAQGAELEPRQVFASARALLAR